MFNGERKAGLASPSPTPVGKAGLDYTKGESVQFITAGASPQIPKAVYVRYKDHVFLRNVRTAIHPAIRETVGWIKEENDEALLVECDRSLLEGSTGFNGLVILRNCIVLMVPINLEHVLNCGDAILRNRVGASCQRGEKLTPKIQNRRKKP
jgi:hypothetical protein